MKKVHPTDTVLSSAPGQMARILKQGEQSSEPWSGDDLRAMVQHQLSTPLEFDLGSVNLSAEQHKAAGEALAKAASAGMKTFGDLYQSAQPPLEVLRLCHKFFKPRVSAERGLTPEGKVAYVFYLTSIIVARLRCQESIAKLTDEQLLQGIRGMSALPWIGERLRSLLSDGEKGIQGL